MLNKIKNQIKIRKAMKLSRRYQAITIEEGGYTKAVVFIGSDKIIEF